MPLSRVTVSLLLAWGAWTAEAARSTSAVSCGVELDREVLPAGEPQRAVVKVTLDAPEPPPRADRPPVNLCIVLDRSGSMSGEKIERAKEAAIEALRRLEPRDLFSMVIYDTSVETIVPAQPARELEWIEGRIRQIQPGGSTALFGGVSQGAAEVRKHLEGGYINRIILLSDGLANVGPDSPADLARLGRSLIKERISVSTVGVGTDYNEDLMTQLAQASDGNTYFVEASVDLPRIFAAELGNVLSVVARDVVIEIECPGGTRPLRIIGREGRIRDNRVEIRLNQLYGGQEKYALIELEVPAAREDEVMEVAVARCSYENMLTQGRESSEGRASARFSRAPEEVVRSANVEVQQEIIRNEAAAALDKAVELMDAGRKDDAVGYLRVKEEELKKTVVDYNLPASAASAPAYLSNQAEDLDEAGMDSRARKTFRQGSYQIRSQQEAEKVVDF